MTTYQTVSVGTLADRARNVLRESERDQVMIAIAGGPGSGKSTLASKVCEHLNSEAQKEIAVVLPMDGYHIPRRDLRAMAEESSDESYEDIMRRRGDPDTFLPKDFAADLRQAKARGCGLFPIYDRSISDPVPDGVSFDESHKIVLCEGLYLLSLDDEHWSPFAELWDDRWLLDVPEEVVRERLVERHLQNWSEEKVATWGAGREGAEKKTNSADLPRTRFIADNSKGHCDVAMANFED